MRIRSLYWIMVGLSNAASTRSYLALGGVYQRLYRRFVEAA